MRSFSTKANNLGFAVAIVLSGATSWLSGCTGTILGTDKGDDTNNLAGGPAGGAPPTLADGGPAPFSDGGAPPPPPSLKTVPVPQPENISNYIVNNAAAVALGKALFWDMQVGSDGAQACASCHFHAGSDARSKNQLNPDVNAVNADGTPAKHGFDLAGPNAVLTADNFPFHKLANPDDRNSKLLASVSSVVGSGGVFNTKLNSVTPGQAKEQTSSVADPDGFSVGGVNVRRVEARNAPSVYNAVFNFRNFWDGRAQNEYNGVSPFGDRDKAATVLEVSGNEVTAVRMAMHNASLASQAMGPPTNPTEMSANGRTFAQIGKKLFGVVAAASTSTTTPSAPTNAGGVGPWAWLNWLSWLAGIGCAPPGSAGSGAYGGGSGTGSYGGSGSTGGSYGGGGAYGGGSTGGTGGAWGGSTSGGGTPPTATGLRPLGKQIVAKDDGVLGALSLAPQPGLSAASYADMIAAAFDPKWWKSDRLVQVNTDGTQTVLAEGQGDPNDPSTFTVMEANFSLLFGLAVQAYESTLVSDDSPYDQFAEGNKSALNAAQQRGLAIFMDPVRGQCFTCHGGPEFTTASVEAVSGISIIRRGNNLQDQGFFNIGVVPPLNDLVLGGNDPFGNPLSLAALALNGKYTEPKLQPPPGSTDLLAVDGAVKVPGLRNVELTAPYFHTGGYATLDQVVDFYSRGGNFDPADRSGHPLIGLPVLNLSPDDKSALSAFLRSLTDDRVRFSRAPFDHPQIFIANGEVGDTKSVARDSQGNVVDNLVELPAVGRGGLAIRPPGFLE